MGHGGQTLTFSYLRKEGVVKNEKLRKLLAGVSIAGLLAGAGLTLPGCSTTKTGQAS